MGGVCGYYRWTWIYQTRGYYTFKLRYHHGAGGSAPVTKGIIDFNRMAAFICDADVLWVGHKHNRFIDTGVRERLTAGDEVLHEPILCVMTGAYMDTYRQQTSENALSGGRRASYGADMNLPPQRKGGVLLSITARRNAKMQNVVDVKAIL